MEILFILAGPPIAAWLVLAIMPRGVPFLIGFGLVVAVGALALMQPLPPSSGPDDWYRGIGHAGAVMGLLGAVCVLPAQLFRWWKGLTLAPYTATLLASTGVITVLALTFGGF